MNTKINIIFNISKPRIKNYIAYQPSAPLYYQ